MYFEEAKKFIYKNARPLDIARWKYIFEGGNRENVLEALAAYQNEDGGFGSALEIDSWNPNSAPVQTWAATEIIKEVKLEDKNHPIIQGILKYLESRKDFDGHMWGNLVPSNNDYPHAPWWSFSDDAEKSYNPTACLIGFIIKFAEEDSEIYKLACRLLKEAYSYFKERCPLESMHTASCFAELYDYIKDTDLVDIREFKELLDKQIKAVITYDKSKWAIDYVCKPSLFIGSKDSDFYLNNKEICDYESKFIRETQEKDGTWAVTWAWGDFLKEWSISENWWKCDLIIKNLKYIKLVGDE